MKKILPSIFIFTIIASLFAPFSVNIKDKKIDKNVANAGANAKLNIHQYSNTEEDLRILLEGEGNRDSTLAGSTGTLDVEITIKDTSGSTVKTLTEDDFDLKNHTYTYNNTRDVWYATYLWTGLTAGQKYVMDYKATYTVTYTWSDDYVQDLSKTGIDLHTFDHTNVNTGLDKSFQNGSSSGGDILPACGLGAYFGTGDGTFPGCIAQVFYYGLFIPTSYLFGLAGIFFDNVFMYSISDSSYRTSFVTQGWGIMRDVCNIFFIFILLYSAFKLILNVGHGEKGTIIAVIIIGLLINFSLFTTKVLIDSSNILARLFYGSETIKLTVDKKGGQVQHGGVNLYDTNSGVLPLSAAIVGQIEPQALIIRASEISVTDDAQGNSANGTQGTKGGSALGVGAFFLVTLLATIINVIGTFVFLSVGLIFVARVIGLWLAMIFVPFAFLSYTVPSMQSIKNIGWKNWWSDTLGMCFLAPIFMFFLYLILVFLQKGFASIIDAEKGPNMVLNIIIPFAFIMIMLMMAKKLAKDYSGSMGQTITGGVAALGGLALGGAALGAAFVGRTAIGRPLKAIANSRGATEHAENMKKWEEGGKVGEKPKASFIANWGYKMNKREESQGHIVHTRHELDEISKKEFNGQSYGELGKAQKEKAKDLLTKEKAEKKHTTLARNKYNKEYRDLSDTEKQDIRTMALSQAKTQVDHSADSKMSLTDSLATSMRKGSYDTRNLSALNIHNMDSWQNKLSSSIIKAIGGGMRGGFKEMVNVNYGKGQKDIFKDLGHTITEAIKSAKFVSIPTGGGGGGHDDHGHGSGGGHH